MTGPGYVEDARLGMPRPEVATTACDVSSRPFIPGFMPNAVDDLPAAGEPVREQAAQPEQPLGLESFAVVWVHGGRWA